MFRRARESDLPAILAMLADDALGSSREEISDPIDERYTAAFAAIDADQNQLLAVAVDDRDHPVGCLQLTFIPGLSRTGMWRGQIESVRIAATERGSGLGTRFVEWAIEVCRERGCQLMQLTSDKARSEAIRFYEKLGFTASHEGMKRRL
jgi:GNAT superfamily N-acetyltransferase